MGEYPTAADAIRTLALTSRPIRPGIGCAWGQVGTARNNRCKQLIPQAVLTLWTKNGYAVGTPLNNTQPYRIIDYSGHQGKSGYARLELEMEKWVQGDGIKANLEYLSIYLSILKNIHSPYPPYPLLKTGQNFNGGETLACTHCCTHCVPTVPSGRPNWSHCFRGRTDLTPEGAIVRRREQWISWNQ